MGKVSTCTQLRLLVSELFCCLNAEATTFKTLIARWYLKSKDKLEEDFDVVKILNTLSKVGLSPDRHPINDLGHNSDPNLLNLSDSSSSKANEPQAKESELI